MAPEHPNTSETLVAYAEPNGRLLLPEGVSLQEFIDSGNKFYDLEDALNNAYGAVRVGNVSLVAEFLEQIVKLNEGFTPWTLRGIPEHNNYFMAMAITKHLENGNPITPEVRKYAELYSLELVARVRA